MFGNGKRPREDSTPPSPEGPRLAEGSFEDKVLSWFTRMEKQTTELKQEQSKNYKEQSENFARAFEALTTKHKALTAKHEALVEENIQLQLKTRLLDVESR